MWPFRRNNTDSQVKWTRHHYLFAHAALRMFAQNRPYEFFSKIKSEGGRKLIIGVWKDVCEVCAGGGTPSFESRDIKVEMRIVNGFPAAVIVMPKPQNVAEAFMVCAVLKITAADCANLPNHPEVRHFTLEKGMNPETVGERTFFCEWQGEKHLNYGDGPEATCDAFVEKVSEFLR